MSCRAFTTFARVVLVFVMVALVASHPGYPQTASEPDANEKKAQGLLNDKAHTFEDLLKRDPGAISNAKEVFVLSKDPVLKQRVASLLVSLGEKDPIYFDYLKQHAEQSLKNDMPWPNLYDEHGNKRSKTIDTLNPEFLRWCKEHHQDPASTFEAAYYEIPVPWYYLAASDDARAYPLLVQGLHSHNFMIQVWASWGLAKLQDPRAIDEIISAVRRAPGETHDSIARALLHFPDPKAQAAADNLFVNKDYLEALRKEIKQKGLKDLFPY